MKLQRNRVRDTNSNNGLIVARWLIGRLMPNNNDPKVVIILIVDE